MRPWLLVLLISAVLALSVTLGERMRPQPAGLSEARQFATMTGGLGMGASAAIYWDFATFDPRLEPDCTCSLWPVPGGFLFSPEHRLTVWDPPEVFLHRGQSGASMLESTGEATSVHP